jgi:hypothetical protein
MVLNDAELYYSLDDADLTGSNPNDISGNGRDGTNNGADTGATGDINEAFDNVAANADYLDCNYDMGATDWTICMKANVDSIASDYGYFSTYSGGTANGIALINDVSVPNINIHNLRRYNVNPNMFKFGKAATYATKRKKAELYIAMCEKLGGSSVLWDNWCEALAENPH